MDLPARLGALGVLALVASCSIDSRTLTEHAATLGDGSGGDTLGTGGDAAGSGGSGAGTGGAAPGAGGTVDQKVCPADELLIDDMEDTPARTCDRDGNPGAYWTTYKTADAGADCALTPSETKFVYADIEAAPHTGPSNKSASIAGTSCNPLYVGLLVPIGWSSQTFDASDYGGVTFWAKGNPGTYQILLEVLELSAQSNGSCDPETEDCYDFPRVEFTTDGNWHQITLKFCQFTQVGWGKMMSQDPQNWISAFSFKPVVSAQDFYSFIDDISFIAGPTTCDL